MAPTLLPDRSSWKVEPYSTIKSICLFPESRLESHSLPMPAPPPPQWAPPPPPGSHRQTVGPPTLQTN